MFTELLASGSGGGGELMPLSLWFKHTTNSATINYAVKDFNTSTAIVSDSITNATNSGRVFDKTITIPNFNYKLRFQGLGNVNYIQVTVLDASDNQVVVFRITNSQTIDWGYEITSGNTPLLLIKE